VKEVISGGNEAEELSLETRYNHLKVEKERGRGGKVHVARRPISTDWITAFREVSYLRKQKG